ncbi:MAG: PSP1 domain-containing protein [Marinifilaceae bacterium]
MDNNIENITDADEQSAKHTPIIDHRILAGKLVVYNWLKDVPSVTSTPEVVEVRFKNTRKAFFSNPSKLNIKEGDIVAVEAALGHDIGIVSLTGELVKEQIRLKRVDLERNPLKKVYRRAKPNDIEKWQQAISLEHDTMIRSRQIASDLKLNMKIGDVEYQGDKTKAIFYYIAEERVDFRQLIKVLAESFRIRIEMKQIGARQEAGRIGGIGPCGRKLCCSTFISNFVSVSTSAARYQDISLNPQKLAGQCGKLKCCLNYELDAYIDAQRDFPSTNIELNTGDGLLYYQKSDIFKRVMVYCYDREGKGMFISLPVDRVKEIIALNRRGIIPPKAMEATEEEIQIKYTDGVGEESLNRFDDKKSKRKRTQRNGRRRDDAPENGAPRTERRDRGERGERNDRGERVERTDRPDRPERADRPERPERSKSVIKRRDQAEKTGDNAPASVEGGESSPTVDKTQQGRRRNNFRRNNRNKGNHKDIKSEE